MLNLPLLSCIMPTADRRCFVEQSLRYFDAQTYPNKELILVDDGQESVFDVCKGREDIRYVSLGDKHSIGQKRNIACCIARGDIVCQWDDDDLYGPDRLLKQAAPILTGEATVTALKMSLLYDLPTGILWKCPAKAHKQLFAYDVRCGTLMYKAHYWRDGLRYEDRSRGEDVAFLASLLSQGATLQAITSPTSYICMRHSSNTTDALDYSGWKQAEPPSRFIPEQARAVYQELREGQQTTSSLSPLKAVQA